MTERIALTEVQFNELKPEDKIYDKEGKELDPRPIEFKEGEFFGTPVVAADADEPTDTIADDSSKPDNTSKTDEQMDAIVKNGIGVLIETLVLTNEITKDYALNRPELTDEQKDKIMRMGAAAATPTDATGTTTTLTDPTKPATPVKGAEGAQGGGRRRSKRRQPKRSAKKSKKGGRSRKNHRKQSRRRKH